MFDSLCNAIANLFYFEADRQTEKAVEAWSAGDTTGVWFYSDEAERLRREAAEIQGYNVFELNGEIFII